MSSETNKATVRAYFRALDSGDVPALEGLFTEDCLIYRPGLAEPLRGLEAIRQIVRNAKRNYSRMDSEIHDLVAEGDLVSCRLTHNVTMAGIWTSRLGTHDVTGRSLTWHPLVLFRFRGDRIAVEWVCRDELGMAIDLGIVASQP
jgi:ketosteroid isomerase-like protein